MARSRGYRPGGKPFRLSASAIGQWDCKYSGYLTYMKRRKPPYEDTINTVFGTSFHEVIDMAMKHNRVDPLFLERSFFIQFDRNVAKAKMEPRDFRRVGRFRAMIPDMVANTIDICEASGLLRRPPVELEKKHILTYRGWQVAVIIDLLMQDETGCRHVFDWKTGQAVNWDEGRPLTAEDVDGNVQLTLYHVAVHKIFGRPPASLNLLYPRDTLRLSLAPRERTHFRVLSQKMDRIIDCVEEFDRTGSRKLFPTAPSADNCRFCPHKDICSDLCRDALKPPKRPQAQLGRSWGKKKRRTAQEAIKQGIQIRIPKQEVVADA